MTANNIVVFDLEANGLNPDTIHVLSAKRGDNKIMSTNNYDNMRKLLTRKDIILVGHNIVRFDIPVVEKILGIKVKAKLVDTLALSWYLYPTRPRHGLAEWGEEFGVPKPPIEDWDNLSYEEYKHRCQEDVAINARLWDKMCLHLQRLYGSDEDAWRLVDYLTWKMDCARQQEELKWKLDVPKALSLQEHLSEKLSEALSELSGVMPDVPVRKWKDRPKKPYKQSGELSAHGVKWFSLLEELGLPEDTTGCEFVDGYSSPNPQSDVQIKDWLYSLGWEPCTHKFARNKETGETREIPQVRRKNENNEAELTPSVERLIEKCPEVAWLRDVGILKHRLSVVEGFINAEEDGYIAARVGGLTNTLRFKHREVVNLPGVDKPYGKDLRGLLTCEDGEVLIGCDVSSLEDTTKRHYMYPHDPKYVEEMSDKDFDPHLNLALFAGAITQQQLDDHIAGIQKQSAVRKVYKCVNYACVYGAGGATVARSAGVSKFEGDKLVEAYWKRNWAVETVAREQQVKTIDGQKWLLNPVSNLWYSLRYDKDRFSTLNQGTGVWVFDTWLKAIRESGMPVVGQMHDEYIGRLRERNKKRAELVTMQAMEVVNTTLGLNQEVRCDVQFGRTYADIH